MWQNAIGISKINQDSLYVLQKQMSLSSLLLHMSSTITTIFVEVLRFSMYCIVFNRTLISFYFSIFQPLKSGTTAVCTLVRGNTLYSAWLGDSQSVLVRNGYPVKVVEPHKPNRPVRLDEYWNHNIKYVVILET